MDAAKSTKSQADEILSIIMLPQGKKKKHSYHRDNLHTTTTLGSLDNVNIVLLNQLFFSFMHMWGKHSSIDPLF